MSNFFQLLIKNVRVYLNLQWIPTGRDQENMKQLNLSPTPRLSSFLRRFPHELRACVHKHKYGPSSNNIMQHRPMRNIFAPFLTKASQNSLNIIVQKSLTQLLNARKSSRKSLHDEAIFMDIFHDPTLQRREKKQGKKLAHSPLQKSVQIWRGAKKEELWSRATHVENDALLRVAASFVEFWSLPYTYFL